MSYKSFAGFYDTFTADVGYKERAEYMLALFARFDKIPSLLLDVGCGSGILAICAKLLGSGRMPWQYPGMLRCWLRLRPSGRWA